MSYIDILFLGIVVLSAFSGWRKGFIVAMSELVSWLLILLLTYLCYPATADFLETLLPTAGIWISLISLLLLLMVFHTAFAYLTHLLLKQIRPQYHYHSLNKTVGILPGLISGILYAVLVMALLLAIPIRGAAVLPDDALIARVNPKIKWLTDKTAGIFSRTLIWPPGGLSISPGVEKSINLGFTVTKGRVRDDLELQMLYMINEERRKAKLDTLTADSELRTVARNYSQYMFSKGYFSHNTPEGKTPFDRLKEAKVRFILAGENLAIAPTLTIAHTGLMNSPGHRANILRRGFGRVGIGIIDGGRHGLMISQEFRN